jgi:MFS transporter, ACS family, glucarate transporter
MNKIPSIMQRSSLIRWRIAAMVGAFAFVSYLQRMNISVAAELMMPGLGLTKIQMGQIFSSFLIGYAIFQVPAGRLGDSVGPKATLAVAALLWGTTTFLTGLLPKLIFGGFSAFVSLAILRFLLGAAEAATFPVGSRAIRNWTPPNERALGNAFMIGELIGGCSYLAAGFVADASRWLAFGFLRYIGICICHGRAVVLGCDELSG